MATTAIVPNNLVRLVAESMWSDAPAVLAVPLRSSFVLDEANMGTVADLGVTTHGVLTVGRPAGQVPIAFTLRPALGGSAPLSTVFIPAAGPTQAHAQLRFTGDMVIAAASSVSAVRISGVDGLTPGELASWIPTPFVYRHMAICARIGYRNALEYVEDIVLKIVTFNADQTGNLPHSFTWPNNIALRIGEVVSL